MRVTALANEGPYSFDWVDKEQNKIELADDCEFDTVPEDVANAIRQHGITIIDESLNNQQTSNNLTNNKNKIDNQNNFTTVSNEDNVKSSSDEKYISFMVRMDNPEDRRKAIDALQLINNDVVNKLELTGPYKVTYKINNSDIEIVGIEDMGIGSKEGKTDN